MEDKLCTCTATPSKYAVFASCRHLATGEDELC